MNYVNSIKEVFETLFDTGPDRALALDNQLNIIAWNKASETVTGVTKNCAVGRNVFDILPRLRTVLKLYNAIMSALEGITVFVPCDRACNDGVMNTVHDVSIQIKMEDRIYSLNALQQEDKRHIEELNAALNKKSSLLQSANEELSAFARIATNNYNETLKNLYLYLEHIITHDAERLSNTSKANIRKAQASIHKLRLLTQDIANYLQLHRLDSAKETVDLNSVVRAIEQEFRENGRIFDLRTDTLPTLKAFPLLVPHAASPFDTKRHQVS